jgi:hypothetical protein
MASFGVSWVEVEVGKLGILSENMYSLTGTERDFDTWKWVILLQRNSNGRRHISGD